MKEKRDLRQVQRWMQAVLMHLGEVAEGVAAPAARQHIDVAPEAIEQVITRSRALPALDRLAIYHNAYHARLLECLREEFPALVHALSQDVFDAFAVGYLRVYPSRSYTLAQLGGHFARYLAETRHELHEDATAGWPDFLIDLATLERTTSEVFDGTGVEGERLLETAQLLAIPPQRWPEARLVPVPCLRLLALRYPIHHYRAGVRRGQDPVPPDPADTFLALTRRDYVVRYHELSRNSHALLSALAGGQSVGAALVAAAQTAGPDLARLAANLRGWFEDWAAAGFFRTVEVPG
jgi:hypothetical protein